MEKSNLFGVATYGYKAERDLFNAHSVIQGRVGEPYAGCFWCEQAIEKYFKHLLASRNGSEEIRMRHKLLPLAREVGFSMSSEECFLLQELGKLYYERYPAPPGEEEAEEPTWEDADSALRLADKVRDWCLLMEKRRAGDVRGSLRGMNLFD